MEWKSLKVTTNPRINGVTFTPIPDYEFFKEWEFPDFHIKYGKMSIVKERGNDLVNHVLSCFPFGKRQLVDIKVQDLKLNHTTCQEGWHLDTKIDPDAIHHLFVLGINRTEFLIDGEVVQLPEGHFATYGNTAQHRGPVVQIPEKRLLIRTTESVKVMANGNFKEKYGYEYPIGGKHVRI